jgi:ABC-2 type transport system permease protein
MFSSDSPEKIFAINMEIKPTPKTSEVFKSLLHADFIVQWRQRRASIMSVIVPLVFIVSWKSLIPTIGAAAVLSICIAVGLPGTGLMGYSATIARDRERGVFQRLRTTPISSWVIMTSRIIVQLVVIAIMVLLTIVFGYYFDHITVNFVNVILLLIAGLVGGLSFLAIGQAIVAFIKSSEAVNAAVRLIYFPLAIVGALGEIGLFGQVTKNIVVWSPLGTTETLLAAAMHPSAIGLGTLYALLATLAYGIIFAGIGIQYFQWSVN